MRKWAKNISRAAVVATGLAVAGAGLAAAPAAADTTSGDFSILGGNQLNAPISAPVNVAGTAASLFGVSNADAVSGSHVGNINQRSTGGKQKTSGNFSVLGGNQANVPVNVPVNVCGNSVAAFGVANSACKGVSSVTNVNTDRKQKTSGKYSIAGGNQANIPVNVPVNVCGNSAGVFGVANSDCKGGAAVVNAKSGHLPSTKRLAGPSALPTETPALNNQDGPSVGNLSETLLGTLRGVAGKGQPAKSNQRVNPDSGATSALDDLGGTLNKTLENLTGSVGQTPAQNRRVVPADPESGPAIMNTVQGAVRSLGIPVPTKESAAKAAEKPQIMAADTTSPGLPAVTEGLPVGIAGTPVLR